MYYVNDIHDLSRCLQENNNREYNHVLLILLSTTHSLLQSTYHNYQNTYGRNAFVRDE